MKLRPFLKNIAAIILLLPLLGRSVIPGADPDESIRKHLRAVEFDYVTWTYNAALIKASQAATGISRMMPARQRVEFVIDFLSDTAALQQARQALDLIYADPAIKEKTQAATPVILQRDALLSRLEKAGPVAESILQSQISETLHDLGLATFGSPIPPVLFHSSPLPFALITSPREVIRQDTNISLDSNLTIEKRVELEETIAGDLGVSTLVEEIGGIGTYPTMIQETSDLRWMIEVVSHEWMHNYLSWHPLGFSYDVSPELRTMNETAAEIAGREIADAVIERYYREWFPEPVAAAVTNPAPGETDPPASSPPAFDFREEMHITRVVTDGMLAAGKIEEAEEYMENRRLFFWQNGYRIRKINQAYFAFHGAYAAVPGGAAGEDPVGPQVRSLRAESESLSEFIEVIAWFSSYEQLQAYLITP